jgi:hypothetical protein
MAKNWNAILPDKAATWGIPTATVQTLDDLTATANEVSAYAW